VADSAFATLTKLGASPSTPPKVSDYDIRSFGEAVVAAGGEWK
jgi:hypothetical protein